MDTQEDCLKRLAEQFLKGELSEHEFRAATDRLAADWLDGATLDRDREHRCGFPEVVFGQGKPIAALVEITRRFLDVQRPLLITRISADQAEELLGRFENLRYNALARTVRSEMVCRSWPEGLSDEKRPFVAVVAAGTSDLPVAEEACETLAWMGVTVRRLIDVGVAGPARLRSQVSWLQTADAIVVCAGMEGALPSAVAGYVSCPVLAVPTSVGYGANLGGFAALLSMLNSCAAHVAVCNIDAGFKGAYLAGLIATRRADAAQVLCQPKKLGSGT